MEQGEILENISKSISERLKVPIVLTYLSVLIIYNWDILFYLIFEDTSASNRITFIKNNYSGIYFERILICLTIAISLIIIFAILNTFLNLILKWFYKKDKATTSEIENYEKIESLTEQLAQSIEEIKSLKSKNENLQNINSNLSSNILDIDISDISRKDYESLLAEINSRGDKEKLRFSLKQYINELKKNKDLTKHQIIDIATYDLEMRKLIEILERRNLVKIKRKYSNNTTSEIFDLSKSLDDILKMKIS